MATLLSGANVPDGKKMLATIDAIPSLRGKRGRPRHRPEKVHADKAYDVKAYDDKKLRSGLPGRMIRHALPGAELRAVKGWGVSAG